jgi:putative oxidoreductase
MKKITQIIQWFFNPPTATTAPAILLIRLMVGGVFLWEGILKFVYTNQGVGRFTKLGFPAPELLAHFVAYLEIFGGLLLIFGFLTRLIAVPFIIEMLVAMASTKISLYLGTSPLPPPPSPPTMGIWALLHEIRTDYAQIMTSLFLLIVGPGPWSIDGILHNRRLRKKEVKFDERAAYNKNLKRVSA